MISFALPYKERRRWSDRERKFGPCFISPWKNEISLRASIGDWDRGDDKCANVKLIAACFGWIIECHLPIRVEIKPSEVLKNGYSYGFSTTKVDGGRYDYVFLSYGREVLKGRHQRSWHFEFPWLRWEIVRQSFYTPNREHFYTKEINDEIRRDLKSGVLFVFWNIKESREAEEKCPKAKFIFKDLDGEEVIATCLVEERECHKGVGWFRWLKYFSTPYIKTSLRIEFSTKVGRKKTINGITGGVTGDSFDILPGETARDCFIRYCEQDKKEYGFPPYKFTFVGDYVEPPEIQPS